MALVGRPGFAISRYLVAALASYCEFDLCFSHSRCKHWKSFSSLCGWKTPQSNYRTIIPTMRAKDDTGDDTTTTRNQAKQERVAQSSSIPERTNEAEIISSGIVSQSPFLTLAPPAPPAPPATPSQTAKHMLSPIASTPRQSMSRHGFVPPMTPSASASGSIQWIPQITPSSTGTGTGAGGVSRRRLSTNLLSKVSVFESTLSLHSTHSDIHASIEFQSPAPSVNEPLTKKSPTTTPTFFPSTPQSSQRRSQRRDSLASKLIHQFNEKVQSPHQSAKLYSPRQVKQLVRLSGGSSHLKNYITESLHSPNQKSTSPHNDEDDSDNDFGGDTPDAPPTLSPHEVRALIESNAKSKLVHGSHEISPEKVHSKSVSDDVLATTTQQHNLDAAKLRQRKCLNDAPPLITTTTTTATATAPNDEVKRPLLPEIPSTTSRMHATATNNSTAAHKAIRNQTLDIVNFVPPQFSKSEEQSALIQEKINEIFVFSELQGNNMEPLIDAFEPLKATPGIEIHAEDEHFYIVQHGEVDIHVDGIMVGRAGRGDCFGEEALLHQSSHSNTTLMATHENTAQLLRLDNRSFRGIVQSHAMESMETKRKIIQGVDFLKPILEQDDQLIHRLASLLVRQQFLQDEEFTVNEEKTFHIVEFGSLRLTNASGTLNFLLEPGDYFGERALLGNLPNKATGEVTMKGASPNKGVFYSMDRGEVEHILGRDRLQKLHDLHTFVSEVTTRNNAFVHFSSNSFCPCSISVKSHKASIVLGQN